LRKSSIPPDEYPELENLAEYKSEYYHGEIFAMGGVSFNQNTIAVNLIHALHSAREKSCRVFSSETDRQQYHIFFAVIL